MGYLELALIGVGLSMDAFAVSVCKGLSMRKVDKKYMFVLAVFFGGFQALIPQRHPWKDRHRSVPVPSNP